MINGYKWEIGIDDSDLSAFVDQRPETVDGYDALLNMISQRCYRIRKTMRALWGTCDPGCLTEYMSLNDTLYKLNTFKAEFEWKRNML
jgi:hypothetical protein